MNGVRKSPKIRYVALLYQITKKYNGVQGPAEIGQWSLVD